MHHLSSSDDELEELVDLLEVPKVKNYFEEIVPTLNAQQYLEHFRVTRETTEQLSHRYQASHFFHHQQGDSEKISPLKAITAFLWFAGNEGATYRDVSDRFGMTKSSLHKIVTRVSYFLSNLSPEIITWPTVQEKLEIERYFAQRDFPGAIGAIDGTHVKIDKPEEDPDSYLNRKHFHSIQVNDNASVKDKFTFDTQFLQ